MRRTRFVFMLILAAVFCLGAVSLPAQAQAKKALIVVPKKDMEDNEYTKTCRALEDAGVEMVVASTSTGTAKGKRTKARVDTALEDVVVAEYDAVVFIGGNGSKKLWKDEDAHRVAREAMEQGKVLAAICASPGTLANAGVLKGKKATAHPKSGAKSIIEDNGGTYVAESVVIDGKLITADGPGSADAYGAAIVEQLQ